MEVEEDRELVYDGNSRGIYTHVERSFSIVGTCFDAVTEQRSEMMVSGPSYRRVRGSGC